MRIFALILLLLSSIRCFAVTGSTNLVGLEVETNGAFLRITIGGDAVTLFGTNAQFFNGFRTNNTPSPTNMLTLSVTSPGFDSTGASQAVGRVVYGTKVLQRPYPMYNTNDIIASNLTNVTARIALTDHIFATDTMTGSALAGYMANTNGGAGNFTNAAAFTGATVTNSSTVPHDLSRVVAKWTWVSYERFTGSYKLRAVAFHHSGIACIKFWASDGHSHSVTQTVTQATIDYSSPDAIPMPEYIATIDPSTFTVGDLITNNFQAFPNVGNTNSICDTSDGLYGIETPYHHPLVCYYDNRPVVSALVSTTNNSGSAGVATTNFNPASPPKAFASISQAAKAIADTNNLLSSANMSYGTIYLRAGSHSFVGTDGSPPTTRPPCWLVITNFSLDGGRDASVIADGTGNGDIQDRIALHGLTLAANAAFIISACSNVWIHNCVLNTTNSSGDFIDGTCYGFYTQNISSNWDQGFRHSSGNNEVFALVRGNWVIQNLPAVNPYCVVGNNISRTNTNATLLSTAASGIPIPSQEFVCFQNKFMSQNNAGISANSIYSGSQNCSNGLVIVQNVFESIGSNQPGSLLLVSADSVTGFSTNVMIWNNTTLGERFSGAYDSINTASHFRSIWSIRGNAFSDFNIKADTFTGDTDGAQGGRVGNWPVLYGVSCWGNSLIEATNVGPAAGSFLLEFTGLSSYQPSVLQSSGVPTGNANPTTFAQWTSDQSQTNWVFAINGAGNGNYRPLSTSPLFFQPPLRVLVPWDIEGLYRGLLDPPGAYASGNVRKGGFF